MTDYVLSVVRIFVTDRARAIRFYTETVEIPAVVRDDAGAGPSSTPGPGSWRSNGSIPATRRAARSSGDSSASRSQWRTSSSRTGGCGTAGWSSRGHRSGRHGGGLLAHFRDPDGNVITLVGRAP